ncbi:hypothetical protein HMPREF0580_0561 [Mobiluncus mulieris ATCC 35239]|uniref:Nitrogen regulatory protein P-II n=2 Tax=Mobiluncus mulieris TaxID=2052 RepID=E0QNU7_9ACTO|nr:hypothetical protein [Mobiluncus mulieris]EFM46843.1 hypothetical protein HMPREF0580_0561 [Mobiluncus mulieris ATCC 35239]MCU9970732.1 transcriptional regulator [Mobiluncus mulieris]MCU9993603.1 transcriptional regulator [Mobiluncus mulieris]MCV0013111.1 transcriptional regulator [Mobiluncus mulieris]NMW80962.1 transcriptional regulator [Mobiluncus mulieris]
MLEKNWHKDAALLYVIVNEEMASKVITQAKRHGIRGATVMLGRGTIKNKWLNLIGVVDSRKEIVIMGTDTKTAREVMAHLGAHFHFEKPNRGIAFATAMQGMVGTEAGKNWPEATARPPADWQLVTTIVERGLAEEVLAAAGQAGSRGGTVIPGRGSGVNQTQQVLGMEIEPEKDIVLMLVPAKIAPAVEEAIDQRLDLEKPNHGILFTQDIIAVTGLYQPSQPSTPGSAS